MALGRLSVERVEDYLVLLSPADMERGLERRREVVELRNPQTGEVVGREVEVERASSDFLSTIARADRLRLSSGTCAANPVIRFAHRHTEDWSEHGVGWHAVPADQILEAYGDEAALESEPEIHEWLGARAGRLWFFSSEAGVLPPTPLESGHSRGRRE